MCVSLVLLHLFRKMKGMSVRHLASCLKPEDISILHLCSQYVANNALAQMRETVGVEQPKPGEANSVDRVPVLVLEVSVIFAFYSPVHTTGGCD